MQIAAPQLAAQLQRGLRSLYTLHGDEPLLIQEAADAIRAAARQQGCGERTVHTVAGAHFDWGEVLASGGSMSLFSDRQLIEIRIPSGKPGKDGSQVLQQIAQAAENNDSTVTVVILPRLDMATQKGAWFAALDSFGVTVRVEAVDRKTLPHWIAQRLQAQGQCVLAGEEGQRTLQFFADRVEGNLLAAHQEIQKLALLHPAGELSLEQVESAVLNVARYDAFKLAEAVLGGQGVRVQRMLDGLQAEGEAPVLVHWALSEDIRTLHRVRTALDAGRPLPMALRENRVWGVKEKLMERALPLLSMATLTRWLDDAHTVDGIVKGLKAPGWPADPWQALQQMAMKVAGACALPAR
ncbi:MAG: DNA polymerase III subunit delta [Hydrogenophaga sp.]|uniref:DNA polymerase III subunit delta n=1 Tax=Hydrogenophaga sp. TaxID=1904254 RepID=UPI00260C6FCC|nr:DNA polymerase III subunit delta [Hydrogenophaga sp.]MDM7942062.1 DNA polymerase III subunit delta [Hydrogenophaga sp.]